MNGVTDSFDAVVRVVGFLLDPLLNAVTMNLAHVPLISTNERERQRKQKKQNHEAGTEDNHGDNGDINGEEQRAGTGRRSNGGRAAEETVEDIGHEFGQAT
eukprot:2039423-Pyramimonas_sp.AAC.1